MASRLFERASAHDVAVGRAFAVSTDGSGSVTVGTAMFRESLVETEQLADTIRTTARDRLVP